VKLARELGRRETGRTLYILDEPTTGLHFDDIRKLLHVLAGWWRPGTPSSSSSNNLDVIKTADTSSDMGPEAGPGGGPWWRRARRRRSPPARRATPALPADARARAARVIAGEPSGPRLMKTPPPSLPGGPIPHHSSTPRTS